MSATLRSMLPLAVAKDTPANLRRVTKTMWTELLASMPEEAAVAARVSRLSELNDYASLFNLFSVLYGSQPSPPQAELVCSKITGEDLATPLMQSLRAPLLDWIEQTIVKTVSCRASCKLLADELEDDLSVTFAGTSIPLAHLQDLDIVAGLAPSVDSKRAALRRLDIVTEYAGLFWLMDHEVDYSNYDLLFATWDQALTPDEEALVRLLPAAVWPHIVAVLIDFLQLNADATVRFHVRDAVVRPTYGSTFSVPMLLHAAQLRANATASF